MKKLILAIDAGTTGSRVLAFNKNGKIKASAYYEIPQIYPKPAWVEHNPYDLFDTVKKALNDVIEKVGILNIDSIGITNQRETTVLWHKKTGQPVHNAIVWQCRRTTSLCQKLKPYAQIIKEKTGLFLDPYFSASKIQWILQNTPNLKTEIKKGNILFGTVDTWLLWNLTGGKAHKSEPSNASRTMLYNIHKNAFDPELLKIFNIPSNILPEIQESASFFGMLDKKLFGQEIPITGILGDQQASLFGQGSLWKKNIIKNTYGTGLFLMATTKNKTSLSQNLITTIAWQIKGKLTYALEGSVFTGGAAIQWLRDGLKIIKNAQETEKLARSLDSNEGVYFIPALSGLGAPYWDPEARGLFTGLTRATTPRHFARAALEAICYQTKDLVNEFNLSLNSSVKTLRADGGASNNNFLMQFQADILNLPVERPKITETTAFGAAAIAGLTSGFWDKNSFLKIIEIEKTFQPHLAESLRQKYYQTYQKALKKCLS